MNPLIEKQLNIIQVADVPDFDSETTHIVIPKHDKEHPKELLLGKYYLISLEDYILNPFDGFTLHDNWNKGIIPVNKYMNCEIIQFMGKMVKISGAGYDFENKKPLETSWEGWLPKSSINIIKEL